ncbi:uncharacterized protein [Narcine bancroftii]|uniref:uncharacterized protein isoform X2 n=1 Tax=Narcine bancroftii TaxID=1343680 RepID=UPI003831441E
MLFHFGGNKTIKMCSTREISCLTKPDDPSRRKGNDKELGEMEGKKSTRNEDILYATLEHTNPSSSNEGHLRSTSTCEYTAITFRSMQETTVPEQDTQEYEDVIPC